jgi:hypothetical protein
MDFLVDSLGTIFGCLVAGFIVYNVVKIILFKFLGEKNVYIVSFIISCVLVVSIYSPLNGIVLFNINYILSLIFWFVIDWVKLKRRVKLNEQYNTDSLHRNGEQN